MLKKFVVIFIILVAVVLIINTSREELVDQVSRFGEEMKNLIMGKFYEMFQPRYFVIDNHEPTLESLGDNPDLIFAAARHVRYDKMQKFYEEAIRLDPSRPEFYFCYAVLLIWRIDFTPSPLIEYIPEEIGFELQTFRYFGIQIPKNFSDLDLMWLRIRRETRYLLEDLPPFKIRIRGEIKRTFHNWLLMQKSLHALHAGQQLDPENAIFDYLSAYLSFRMENEKQALQSIRAGNQKKRCSYYEMETAKAMCSYKRFIGTSKFYARLASYPISLSTRLRELAEPLRERSKELWEVGDRSGAFDIEKLTFRMGKNLSRAGRSPSHKISPLRIQMSAFVNIQPPLDRSLGEDSDISGECSSVCETILKLYRVYSYLKNYVNDPEVPAIRRELLKVAKSLIRLNRYVYYHHGSGVIKRHETMNQFGVASLFQIISYVVFFGLIAGMHQLFCRHYTPKFTWRKWQICLLSFLFVIPNIFILLFLTFPRGLQVLSPQWPYDGFGYSFTRICGVLCLVPAGIFPVLLYGVFFKRLKFKDNFKNYPRDILVSYKKFLVILIQFVLIFYLIILSFAAVLRVQTEHYVDRLYSGKELERAMQVEEY